MTTTINYPKAVSYDAALKAAMADERWSDEERAALSAIVGDARNGGRIHGSGRVFGANGVEFAMRYAASGINVKRHS